MPDDTNTRSDLDAGTVNLPGPRDAVASHDAVAGARACVVACPPHPRHGGSRSDGRLRAVSRALRDRGVACLRIDYGPWDRGRGERADAARAVAWARDRYERVAIVGYSFGGAVAILAGAEVDPLVAAVAALAPVARPEDGSDAAAAVARLDCPLQVVYGSRDDAADWRPVVEAARERARDATARTRDGDAPETAVVEWAADHFFIGQAADVATTIATFLTAHVDAESRGA